MHLKLSVIFLKTKPTIQHQFQFNNTLLHSLPWDLIQYTFLPFLSHVDALHLQEAVKFSLPLRRKISSDTLIKTLNLFVSTRLRVNDMSSINNVVESLSIMKYALHDLFTKSTSYDSIQNFMGVFDSTLRNNLVFIREALLGIPSRVKILQVADKYELQVAEEKLQNLLDHLIQKRDAFNKCRRRSS